MTLLVSAFPHLSHLLELNLSLLNFDIDAWQVLASRLAHLSLQNLDLSSNDIFIFSFSPSPSEVLPFIPQLRILKP